MGKPVTYTISLEGRSDDGDVDAVRTAFEKFVQELRAADVTVGGTLSGHQLDRRGEDSELIPGRIIHINAIDVAQLGNPTLTRKKHPKGPTPAEVEAETMARHEGNTAREDAGSYTKPAASSSSGPEVKTGTVTTNK